MSEMKRRQLVFLLAQAVLYPILLCGVLVRQELGCINAIRGGSIDDGGPHCNSRFEVVRPPIKQPSESVVKAMKQCEAAISRNPKNDEMVKGPSYCLGLLKQSLGDLDGALECYKRATERFPQNGLAIFNAGNILESLGRFLEAVDHYKAALHVEDICEAALSKVTLLLVRTDREDEAIEICQNIYRSGPVHVKYIALENLATAYHKKGDFLEALRKFESAIEVCQSQDQTSLAGTGEESSIRTRRVVRALSNAAAAAQVIGDNAKAEGYLLKAIDLDDSIADSWTNYGVLLKSQGRKIEAIDALRKAIALDPDEHGKETGYAVVQLASLSGGLSTTKMSLDYVEGLFNGYADKFDDELCNKLQYCGHEHVVEALVAGVRRASAVGPQEHRDKEAGDSNADIIINQVLNIADIGCGTGLCGSLLRQLAPSAVITGVDLAQRMLDKAARREKVYDSLVLADAVKYLESRCEDASLHAIVAADVFIYIGALDRVFELARKKLAATLPFSSSSTSSPSFVKGGGEEGKGGFLIFTVEELDESLSISTTSTAAIGTTSSSSSNGYKLDDSSDSNSSNRTQQQKEEQEQKEQQRGIMLLSCGRFGHSERYIRSLAEKYDFHVASMKREILRTQNGSPVKSITFCLRT